MNKKAKKTIYMIIAMILIVSFLLQIILEGFDDAGFYAVFGFAGAWALILFAKRILAPLLQKPEDYYGGGRDD